MRLDVNDIAPPWYTVLSSFRRYKVYNPLESCNVLVSTIDGSSDIADLHIETIYVALRTESLGGGQAEAIYTKRMA